LLKFLITTVGAVRLNATVRRDWEGFCHVTIRRKQ